MPAKLLNIKNLPLMILFLTGLFVTLMGALLLQIATYYDVPDYVISYHYFSFTLTNGIVVMFNGRLMDFVSPFDEIRLMAPVMILSLILLIFSRNLMMFTVAFFLTGLSLGMMFSAGHELVNRLTSDSDTERTSKLNLTHFFFGLGAFTSPFIASQISRNHLAWQWNYLFLILILILILMTVVRGKTDILLMNTQEEENNSGSDDQVLSGSESDRKSRNCIKAGFSQLFYQKIRVTLTSLSLMMYVLGEQIFSLWIAAYFIQVIHVSKDFAQIQLSLFWAVFSVGRLTAVFVSKKIPPKMFVFSTVTIASIGLMLLMNSDGNIITALAAVIMIGFFLSANFSTILSMGMQNVQAKTKVMTLHLTIASVGGTLASPLAGKIKELIGISEIMLSVLFCFLMIILLVVLISWIDRIHSRKISGSATSA